MNDVIAAVGLGAVVVVVVLVVVVLVVVVVVEVVVGAGTVVVVDAVVVGEVVVVVVDVVELLVVVEELLLVVPVGTVVELVVVEEVSLGVSLGGEEGLCCGDDEVVVVGVKTIHVCAIEPEAHFFVALTTARVFELLQMLRVPVERGIAMGFVPRGQRKIGAAMSFFVEDCSHTLMPVGDVAGNSFLLPETHLPFAKAVTNPDLLPLHTTEVEFSVASVGRARKKRPIAIATAPMKICWRIDQEGSANFLTTTLKI